MGSGSALSLRCRSDFRSFYRIDFRQVSCDAGPAFAFVASHPEFTASRAKVEAERVARVRRHRLALDGPPRLLYRHSGALPLPCLAAVARHIDRRFALWTGARPDA